MMWLLVLLTLQTARTGPSLWPFLFLLWGLCACVLWFKGWLW
jgi:hypothetical protein